MKTKIKKPRALRVGIIVPHIFMHRQILPDVIFAPATLALDLADGLERLDVEVTLFTPGPVDTPVRNVTADTSYFEKELRGRGDSYIDLLKKHPFTFITLARQLQSELIAEAYAMANAGQLDIIHVYTNEEETALPFAKLCSSPVVFTHHDPFNFLIKYKNFMSKYKQLNWISISYAQRAGMPPGTNWVENIYHGLPPDTLQPFAKPSGDYIAYLGRIIEPKGVHLAIEALRLYNESHKSSPLKLKLAGKHYADHKKDTYWQEEILPHIDEDAVEYVGFINAAADKQQFLGNAKAVVMPSTFNEPFGMVAIESLACGTPIIGLNSGALPEIVKDGINGILAKKSKSPDGAIDEAKTAKSLSEAIGIVDSINRQACRQDFESRFTLERMCREHLEAYRRLTQ